MPTATASRQTGRRGRPVEWSDARVREELLHYLAGGRQMPTALELDCAGRADLRYAITTRGGSEYWARELGLQLSPRQTRGRTPENLLVERARQLARATGYLPGANKLRQLGHAELATLVARSGGSRRFCKRLGIAHLDGRTRAARRRT